MLDVMAESGFWCSFCMGSLGCFVTEVAVGWFHVGNVGDCF